MDAKTWLQTHWAPLFLEGQVFLYVDVPNRYTIPAFFELHVDWNNHVFCAGQ